MKVVVIFPVSGSGENTVITVTNENGDTEYTVTSGGDIEYDDYQVQNDKKREIIPVKLIKEPIVFPGSATTEKYKVSVNTGFPNYALTPNANSMKLANKLVDKLQKDQTMTSGYRSESGGPHGQKGGNAFDFGHNANSPKVPREEMKAAYEKVFDVNNSMAMEEVGCYHFQLQPGLGGATGFMPGLRDKNGKVVEK